MDLIEKHAAALEKVRSVNPTSISFHGIGQGLYNEANDSFGDPSPIDVAGYVVEIPGDLEEYEKLELLGKSALTLFFVPITRGQFPDLENTVTWAGDVRTVKALGPIRPDGTVIAGKVIVT